MHDSGELINFQDKDSFHLHESKVSKENIKDLPGKAQAMVGKTKFITTAKHLSVKAFSHKNTKPDKTYNNNRCKTLTVLCFFLFSDIVLIFRSRFEPRLFGIVRDVAAAPQTPQLGGAQANFGGPS